MKQEVAVSQPATPPSNPPASYGRVGDDGTVYVTIGAEEHAVGQYPEGSAEEALAFYVKRFEGLEVEVALLEQRIQSAALSPDEANTAVEKLARELANPSAVGDLIGLRSRLDLLRPVIELQRKQRKEERAKRQAEAAERKQKIVATAEKIAQGTDWRHGAHRFRELLKEWKQLPRLSRASDDELWRKFSAARSTYTKARKQHFAQLDEQRAAAAVIKRGLIRKAEALSSSTNWRDTAQQYRDLMRQWKAAGPAPREVEEELWQQFRGAQDIFFSARDEAQKLVDAEYADNAVVKEAILKEAEALLPITDLDAAKEAYRGLVDRWEAAGKVPRADIKRLESGMQKIADAIRAREDELWQKSDPEKSARADDMISKLKQAITELEAKLAEAKTAGNTGKIKKLESDLESRRAFLAMAEKTAAEFS